MMRRERTSETKLNNSSAGILTCEHIAFHIKFVVTKLLKAADINNRVVSDSVTLG